MAAPIAAIARCLDCATPLDGRADVPGMRNRRSPWGDGILDAIGPAGSGRNAAVGEILRRPGVGEVPAVGADHSSG